MSYEEQPSTGMSAATAAKTRLRDIIAVRKATEQAVANAATVF
jgi:hypothetical protein